VTADIRAERPDAPPGEAAIASVINQYPAPLVEPEDGFDGAGKEDATAMARTRLPADTTPPYVNL